MKRTLPRGVVIAILLFSANALARTTWFVDAARGNDQNQCRTWRDACKTIGKAISLAGAGDAIRVGRRSVAL